MEKKDLKVRTMQSSGDASRVRKYQDLVVGQRSTWALLKYELVILLSSRVPGALGLALRSRAYPLIIGEIDKGTVFGTGVTLRHAHKIRIGRNVVIDDNCMLDAKGIDNTGITIQDNVFIGRNSILSCKDGDIDIESGVNIGFNCEIYSANKVSVHKDALIGASTYLVGGGEYDLSCTEISFAEQVGLDTQNVLVVESGAWLGAGVTVLNGVRIGSRAVVGARALVREDVPTGCIAAGVPAKVIGERPGSC